MKPTGNSAGDLRASLGFSNTGTTSLCFALPLSVDQGVGCYAGGEAVILQS